MIDAIKIGAINYKVSEKDDLYYIDNDGRHSTLHGDIRWAEADIRIASDQDEQVKIATLWHEAVHGILNNAGFDEHPENIVTALGYGLTQLVRDNPALIRLTTGDAAKDTAT